MASTNLTLTLLLGIYYPGDIYIMASVTCFNISILYVVLKEVLMC